MTVPASYTWLSDTQWDEKIAAAYLAARSCSLCPRRCGVNRIAGEQGFCAATDSLRISSIFAHHGEEPPISGTSGSGTVFFSHCTLRCIFCQNYQISHEAEGQKYSSYELGKHLVALQEKGCHNVNLVTPTHYLPWILESLRLACADGLHIPVVYNCSGYETLPVLAILRDIVDIYLPDMKYGDNAAAKRYSTASDYVEVNRLAIREMFRQTGPLRTDTTGIARRGLVIRHLILPDGEAGSDSIRRFLIENFDPHDMTLSVMAQYRPLYRAPEFGSIARTVMREEYEPVRDAFLKDGFEVFYQEWENLDTSFVINFKQRKFDSLTGH